MWVEVVFQPRTDDFEARRELLRATITNVVTLRARLHIIDDEERRWRDAGRPRIRDNRRRYTYWVNGRSRPRVGDRVRVPVQDGTDEKVAEVRKVIRDADELTWAGPYDEVIEIVERAPRRRRRAARRERHAVDEDSPCAFRREDGSECGRVTPHTHILEDGERVMRNYVVQDAAAERQMNRVMMQFAGAAGTPPGEHQFDVESVEADDRGLRFVGRLQDSVMYDSSPPERDTRIVTDVWQHYADHRVTRLIFNDGTDLEIAETDQVETVSPSYDTIRVDTWLSPFSERVPIAVEPGRVRVVHQGGEATPWYDFARDGRVHAV